VTNQPYLSAKILRPSTQVFVMALLCVLTMVATQPAQAQTFTPLHNFTGGSDGGNPWAGVTMDRAGNLYGTTCKGGQTNNGVVYKLTQKNGAWLLNPLYDGFSNGIGACPYGAVTIGPDGALYGTTWEDGPGGYGTVFKLTPPAHAPSSIIAPWTLTVLHSFTGGSDGANPTSVVLVFDAAGNLYGTTSSGGSCALYSNGCGTVFELTPTAQGQWRESILYTFTGGNDGALPQSGLIFDSAGNLYGTTAGDGVNSGTVFKLTPSASGWVESTLHAFGHNDDDEAREPEAGLTFDSAGNLYGTTACSGYPTNGTVFELMPQPDGSWTETVLTVLSGLNSACGGPYSGVIIDAAGNLITSRYAGGEYGNGAGFELTPSGGGWLYQALHDFQYFSDGDTPIGNLLFDGNGNIFGTASEGGASGGGVVWEITP